MTDRMLKMYNNFSKVVDFEKLPDPTDVWELGPVIGEGTYGEVFKGFNKKTGNEKDDFFFHHYCFWNCGKCVLLLESFSSNINR